MDRRISGDRSQYRCWGCAAAGLGQPSPGAAGGHGVDHRCDRGRCGDRDDRLDEHARTRPAHELESSAARALGDGTAWALAGMAFLAVLKEGFETSVFLLAAFESSTSILGSASGALIGLALAVAIGVGIFRGGVRLNLARFFRITGIFLVLVAAGLVLSALRTAHEAGWIQIGQQATITLSWLAPAGSVQAALLTGVLGIPADPRLIELVGWVAYLVPTMLFLLWPVTRRPQGRALATMRLVIAGSLVVVASVLAAGGHPAHLHASSRRVDRRLRRAERHAGTASGDLRIHGFDERRHRLVRRGREHEARTTDNPRGHWFNSRHLAADPSRRWGTHLAHARPAGQRSMAGACRSGSAPRRIPARSPRTGSTAVTVRMDRTADGILDANRTTVTTVATLTGGGLASSRTLSPASAQSGAWRIPARRPRRPPRRASVVPRLEHRAVALEALDSARVHSCGPRAGRRRALVRAFHNDARRPIPAPANAKATETYA